MIVQHHQHSPDLASYDFCLFPRLTKRISGHQFKSRNWAGHFSAVGLRTMIKQLNF